MTNVLLARIEPQTALDPDVSAAPRAQAILDLVDKYATHMPCITPAPGARYPTSNLVILVTGTTGALGSDFLAKLLQSPKVARVYALNRTSSDASIQDRQLNAFRHRSLSFCISQRKLTQIQNSRS
jgi:hypothetical protein